MVEVSFPCSHGKRVFRSSCGRETQGQCVYCGRRFCNAHGTFGDEFLEVCDRAKCRAKFDDVKAHRAWIEKVRVSNRLSNCAIEDCQMKMQHECGRCRLIFCDGHLKTMDIIEHRPLPQKVPIILCLHCRARRKLWDS